MVATIYVATTESGCLAELHRLLGHQARGAVSFPRHLHRIELTNIVAVDLTTDEILDAVGLTPDDVTDDDWTACQAVGNAVQYLGVQALRAASATGDGHILAPTNPTSTPDSFKSQKPPRSPGQPPDRGTLAVQPILTVSTFGADTAVRFGGLRARALGGRTSGGSEGGAPGASPFGG